MFVFCASDFVRLLEQHQPEIHRTMTSIQGVVDVEAFYDRLPNLSIDYSLAEKAEKVAVVPVAIDTKDSILWGSNGLLGWRAGHWPLWFPLLVFSPFILDASVTLVKRLLRR